MKTLRIMKLLLSGLLLPMPTFAGTLTGPINPSTANVHFRALPYQFALPVQYGPAPDNSGRHFVVDQPGQIYIIDGNGQLLPDPFLDISGEIVPLGLFGTGDPFGDYDERGLLGFAFHPNFDVVGATGYQTVYSYYSVPLTSSAADFTVPLPAGVAMDHQSVLAEWKVDPANPNQVDMTTFREVLRIDQPQFNHNGGMLGFGPSDGLLYIGLGDGGGANDVGPGHGTDGNGQDKTNVLSTILRIDADGNNSTNGAYGIPTDNPFLSEATTPNEIYAYGIRNGWRFSWDAGRMIVADVGQNQIEEVNIVVPGGNYGWSLKEGSFAFDRTTGEVSSNISGIPSDVIDPVLEYDHEEGRSIIGGFVYRGDRIRELQGKYIFADWSREFFAPDGRLFAGDLDTGEIEELAAPDLYIYGIGQDNVGELYMIAGKNLGPFGQEASIYRILPEPTAAALAIVALLSAAALLQRAKSNRTGVYQVP